MKRPVNQPTPATWIWWRAIIVGIVRSFFDRREITAAECLAMVDDRDAKMRAALSGEIRR